MIAITKIQNDPPTFLTNAEAQKIAHCSYNTIVKIVKEMENLVGSRYKAAVTIDGISNKKLIDRLAFNDYIRNREKIRNKIPCAPYDPRLERWLLGGFDQELEERK